MDDLKKNFHEVESEPVKLQGHTVRDAIDSERKTADSSQQITVGL